MNLSRVFFIFCIIFVLVSSSVNTISSISSDVSSLSLCPRETGLFIDTIKNEDSIARSYSISLSGSASEWVVSAPTSFILNPREEKKVYTYVTPFESADIGNYDLKVEFDYEDNTKRVVHEIKIKDCYGIGLATGSQSETSCPNEAVTYKATLINEGNSRDTFSLDINGEIEDLVKLDKDILVLEPNQEQEITAFINSPAESGDYSFTLKAENSKNSRSVNFDLNVKSCYGYDLTLRRGDGEYSLCEHSVIVVPLNINNDGTTKNKFNIELDNAPIWTRLDKSTLEIGVGEAKTFNLVLAPDFGVVGNYTIKIIISPERGDKKATVSLNFEVRNCHSVDLDIDSEEDVVCKGINNAHSVSIKNNGEVAKDYNITIQGPSWVSLGGDNILSLNPGRETNLVLLAEPTLDVEEGTYEVTARASSMDISNTFDEDKIVFDVKSVDVCFAPVLETQYTNVVVHSNSGLLVPIVLKNNGIKESGLKVYLSGNAVDFSKLAENEIDLDPGQNKTIYLYLAPNRDTVIGQYTLDLELYTGNDFYKATRMNVEVTDNLTRVTVIDGTEEVVQQESWAGLKYFMRTYKYYLAGGLVVLLIIILALIFGRKTIDFFDEDFEEEKTKKRKKN